MTSRWPIALPFRLRTCLPSCSPLGTTSTHIRYDLSEAFSTEEQAALLAFRDVVERVRIRDGSVRASITCRKVVFSLYGADGGESYAAHFHFRSAQFHQRIVEHLSTRRIEIGATDERSQH